MATVRNVHRTVAGQEHRAPTGADHPRRGAHLRMDSWFPSLKIYNRNGQLYTAVDAELMLAYWRAKPTDPARASTKQVPPRRSPPSARPTPPNNEPMIPIYIFYSMFGFQRTGDGFWAAADQMACGSSWRHGRAHHADRRGLQHADGHSRLLASTNPAGGLRPAFAYEMAYIIEDGLWRDVRGESGERVLRRSTTSRTRSPPNRRTSTSRACCAASPLPRHRSAPASRRS